MADGTLFGDIWTILKETAVQWFDNQAPRLAAALAYYSLISLAPLLIIAVKISGFIFGEKAARGELFYQAQQLIGATGAAFVQSLILNANVSSSGIATLFAVVTLVVGASAVFVELQSSLDTIWKIPSSNSGGFKGFVKTRLLSFIMILGIGCLLFTSMLLSAFISAVGNIFQPILPGMFLYFRISDILLSFALSTFLFAMIYKILPPARIAWKHVWIGAFVTSFLFTLGKFLIGLYLGYSSIASAYGAAGSLIVFLIWVYYSAQVFLFGAELTYVYSTHAG